ncbi:hypothetical protein WJX73_001687 [Symbiochloris irregularis]|uniref:Uncharacterized protein n=1 Tax=Symbiochloris irregularis TaxID=706552 RepID=A0AAW1NU10_9CHLO
MKWLNPPRRACQSVPTLKRLTRVRTSLSTLVSKPRRIMISEERDDAEEGLIRYILKSGRELQRPITSKGQGNKSTMTRRGAITAMLVAAALLAVLPSAVHCQPRRLLASAPVPAPAPAPADSLAPAPAGSLASLEAGEFLCLAKVPVR